MTIHDTHPFADPDPDPVRRLRGRLGGAVTLVTAGDADGRAGLTVSSLMVANGDPAHVLLLVDPDSDLADVVQRTGRAVVQLLSWSHRDLAEAFAGSGAGAGRAVATGVVRGHRLGSTADGRRRPGPGCRWSRRPTSAGRAC